MILKIYGVRDSVALDTGLLLTAPSDEMLARNVKMLLLQGLPALMTNIQDLSIFEIGELDTSTGKIIGLAEPVQVFHCLELFNEAKEERRRIFGDEKSINGESSEEK